jgi:ABC-type phosphate transport system substrate-binding protein
MESFLDNIYYFLRLTFCISLVWLAFFAFPVGGQTPVIQVVVNTSVESKNINVRQIRRIFSMRQTTWPDGQAITVYVLSHEHSTHQIFSTKVLRMFPYQLERIWNKLVYSGLGEGPVKVQSEMEMLERVSQKPGAVGYVLQRSSDVSINVIQVLEE